MQLVAYIITHTHVIFNNYSYEWAIDSEAMRVRGIIVLVKSYRDKTTFSWLKLDVNPFLPPKIQRSSLLVGYNIIIAW